MQKAGADAALRNPLIPGEKPPLTWPGGKRFTRFSVLRCKGAGAGSRVHLAACGKLWAARGRVRCALALWF
jgi:hypothetical protein